MAETTSQDRLQPSLLDRLTDLEPQSASESQDQRVLSQRQLRRSLVRDLEWLLNTGKLDDIQSLQDFPYVQDAVINFGVPDVSGSMVTSLDVDKLAADLKRAIVTFEPRVNPRTLEVTGELASLESRRNAVIFEISAEMWGDPAPLHLMLKTEVDLETGQVAVQDYGG